MDKPQIQTVEQARDWFSNKENNKDGIGVICLRQDGHTGRMGNVEEAQEFYSMSGPALSEEEMEAKFPTPAAQNEQGEEKEGAGE